MKKITIIFAIIIAVFFLGWCSKPDHSGVDVPNSTAKLKAFQRSNDSLTKITTALEGRNAMLELHVQDLTVKIKQSDSARLKEIVRFRGLITEKQPCDSALPEVVKVASDIITTDSTEISEQEARNDSLGQIHKNDVQIHQNDLIMLKNDSMGISIVKLENADLRKALKKQHHKTIWANIRTVFIAAGSVIGAIVLERELWKP